MSEDEYVIINESKLLKRIEDLENAISKCILPEQQHLKDLFEQELEIKTQILSQSTPLIPEIEKLIVMSSISNIDFLPDRVEKIKQDYISNLKLDI
jgi:hypothetical protein